MDTGSMPQASSQETIEWARRELRRLLHFIQVAPAGTMVPVEALRELLVGGGGDHEKLNLTAPPRFLTPREAADWLHAQLGGRKRTAAAVRKVMRTGFRGVVLKSYPYGRERRTTEADLRVYVEAIGAFRRPAAPQKVAVPALSNAGFHVESDADPGDEIAAAQERFRQHRQAPLRSAPRQRRAAGGG